MSPLRLAIIGAGHLGRIHARLATELSDVELVAVCDPSEATRNEIAAAYDTTPIADYRDIIPQIDAAIVAAPTSLHCRIGSELASRGIHCFIEKPLAPTVEEADALVAIAEQHDVVLQVGHVERFNPALQSAAPYLVEPKYVEARRLSSYPFRSTDTGVVMDLMIHDIDVILSLVHSGVRSVDALGFSVLGGNEDVAQARVTFDSGCVANLTASRVSYETCRKTHIWTSTAFASLDFASGQSTVTDPSADVLQRRFDVNTISTDETAHLKEHLFEELLVKQVVPSESVNAIAEEHRDFIASIRTGQAPRVSGTSGRDAVALAERILVEIENHAWDGDADGRRGPFAMSTSPILRGPHWHTTAPPARHREAS